jgi:hypothetical protein
MSEKDAKGNTKYPHDSINAFANGCNMDLRVRLALSLLNGQLFHGLGMERADTIANQALEVAGSLLARAEKAGWIDALPDHGDLEPEIRHQAKRLASFNVLQQIEGQNFGRQETSGLAIPMAPPVGGGPRQH